MQWILALFAVALLLSGPARAGLDEGVAAYVRGDYMTALREFLPLAEFGSPVAQYDVALLYQSGLGVPRDYALAAKWFGAAADRGFAEAQFSLGNLYAAGKGVTRNYGESAKWFRRAAEQGHSGAQHNLAIAYYKAQGAEYDKNQAYFWLTLATPGLPAGTERERSEKLRTVIAETLTPEELARNRQLAADWRPTLGAAIPIQEAERTTAAPVR